MGALDQRVQQRGVRSERAMIAQLRRYLATGPAPRATPAGFVPRSRAYVAAGEAYSANPTPTNRAAFLATFGGSRYHAWRSTRSSVLPATQPII